MPPVGHPPSPDHAGRIDQRRIEIKSFKNKGWVGGRSGRRGSIVDHPRCGSYAPAASCDIACTRRGVPLKLTLFKAVL